MIIINIYFELFIFIYLYLKIYILKCITLTCFFPCLFVFFIKS